MSTNEIQDEFAGVFEADRRRKVVFAVGGLLALLAMLAFMAYFGAAAGVEHEMPASEIPAKVK